MKHLHAVWRGLTAIAYVLGWQLAAVLLCVITLLVYAVATHIAGLAAVALGIAAILAIRAHDVGLDELERLANEPEPTEYELFWHEPARSTRTLHVDDVSASAIRGRQQSRYDPTAWEAEQIRHRVALGKPHPPAEL